MAFHVVDLDPFDPSSVRRANAEMRRLLKEFDKKVDQFLVELATIGKEAAEGAYGNGGAVVVTVEIIDNGCAIIANGDAVVFLEFGAGSAVNTGNRYVETVQAQGGFEIRRGSYSDSQEFHPNSPNGKGEYANTGYDYWTFGGVRYTEVLPRNGMEKAYEAIQQDIRSVAQRVFG